MTLDWTSHTQARERIARAYDPTQFARGIQQWGEVLAGHYARVTNGDSPVLNWNSPDENVQAAYKALSSAPTNRGEPQLERFRDLLNTVLKHGQNLHHPHYVGHQVPASIPWAGLFDAVCSLTNQVMAVYEMGPWGTAVELALVQHLTAALGWNPEQAAGVATHGGAPANLTALLAARNVSLGDAWEQGLTARSPAPVLICQADAHYSMVRAGGVMGLGTHNVLKAPLDARRRMDPQALDDMLTKLRRENRPIVAVVACACATPIGAFDPLPEVAEVCRRHAVWMHIDAAHGGSAALSTRYRHLMVGAERADSVVWDAHKMLFVPALCAFVLYRDRAHSYRAFQQEAPYLFDPSAPDMREFDLGLRTLECTKRTAAYGLWGAWSMFGPQLFADLVDVTFDLGKLFHDKLAATDDFQVLHEPQCNIVVFRHRPPELAHATPEQRSLYHYQVRRKIIESGKFYLVHNVIGGEAAFRVTLMNPLTTGEDLDELLAEIRRVGKVQWEQS